MKLGSTTMFYPVYYDMPPLWKEFQVTNAGHIVVIQCTECEEESLTSKYNN